MNGIAQQQIRRLVVLAVAILLFNGFNTFALQEKVSPLSDYQYNKKDLPQYEAIKKEADPQKRADLLLAFIKERAVSKVLIYATNDYLECMKPYLSKNEFAKAIPLIESYLALLPAEKAMQEGAVPAGIDEQVWKAGVAEYVKVQLQPSQKLLLSSLAGAYYQSQNWPKAAETVEKIYEIAPDKATLPVLADIYLRMQNADKYLAIGQKMLAEFPMDQPQGYDTAIKMAQVYIQKQDIAAATDLLTKVMDVYGDKVPPNMQEAQWNPTRAFAYGAIASGFYAKKDYPKAQELYEKVARFEPKREDAYYYIGMCKWQTKDPEGAIASFAKCVVLNGQLAKKAQGYLEDLYKARHNNTLDGLDQLLAKAKSELGM
jgi:tetratricopeptide (TPR) repeat protein